MYNCLFIMTRHVTRNVTRLVILNDVVYYCLEQFICNAIFTAYRQFVAEEKSQRCSFSNNLISEVCGRTCTSRSGLISHSRTHRSDPSRAIRSIKGRSDPSSSGTSCVMGDEIPLDKRLTLSSQFDIFELNYHDAGMPLIIYSNSVHCTIVS